MMAKMFKAVVCLVFFVSAQATPLTIPIMRDSCIFENRLIGYNNRDIKANGQALVLKHFIKSGHTLIDVGANLGDWIKEALAIAPTLSIFAFEPLLTRFEQLRKNITEDTIALFNMAIAQDSQDCDLFYCEEDPSLSGFYKNPAMKSKPKVLKVKAIDLDSFCKNSNIKHVDFLKIEADGAELKVLQGAHQLLETNAIDVIQFNYGESYKDAQTTLQQVYAFLQDRNYRIYRVTPDGLVYIPAWRSSLEIYRYSNYVAVSKKYAA